MRWTLKNIQDLAQRAHQAQTRIKDLFLNHVIPIDDNHRAWGQFFNLDNNNPQHGIFGTSSGVQVVSQYGIDPNNIVISGGCSAICEIFDPEINNRFRQKGDLDDVYKLVFIVEACPPNIERLDNSSPQMELLVARQINQTGWGEYYSDQVVDPFPRILPTALALLALNRYSGFPATESARRGATWLANEIVANHAVGISELALSTLALNEYRAFHDVEGYEPATKYCQERLAEWAKNRRRDLFGSKDYYPYVISPDGTKGNRYIFLLPDCLVALSLLRTQQYSVNKKYILSVVSYFVTQILDHGGFSSDDRRRISTVDHLWIFRLLKEFRKVPAAKLLPLQWYVVSSFPVVIRVIAALLLLVAGVVGTYFEGFQSEWSFWKVFFFVLGALGIGLCIEILSHVLLKKDH